MHILEHNPVSCFTSLLEGFDSGLFLTLSHGNVDEGSFSDRFSTHLTDKLDFWSWVNTREKYEEYWSLWVHFFLSGHNVEWWGLNVS